MRPCANRRPIAVGATKAPRRAQSDSSSVASSSSNSWRSPGSNWAPSTAAALSTWRSDAESRSISAASRGSRDSGRPSTPPAPPAVRSNSLRNNGFPSARSTIASTCAGASMPVPPRARRAAASPPNGLSSRARTRSASSGKAVRLPGPRVSTTSSGRSRASTATLPRRLAEASSMAWASSKMSAEGVDAYARRSCTAQCSRRGAAKARLELVHLAGRRYGDVDDVGEQGQERLELGRALADRPPQLSRDDLVGSVVGEPEEHDERLGGTAGTASRCRTPRTPRATCRGTTGRSDSDTRRDLPMPGAPMISITPPEPAAAAPARRRISSSSARARQRADRRRSLPRRPGGVPRGPPPRPAPTCP